MSKRAEMPQSRHHVLIFDEDWEWLDANCGPYSESRMGVGVAIRKIVHYHVRVLRQKAQEAADRRGAPGGGSSEAGVLEETEA